MAQQGNHCGAKGWQGPGKGRVFHKLCLQHWLPKAAFVQQGATTRVRATRDYEAVAEEELSFPAGAVMFVVARYVQIQVCCPPTPSYFILFFFLDA